MSPHPAAHPQACALSPSPGQSPVKLMLGMGYPPRPLPRCLHPSGVPSAASSGDKGTESAGSEIQLPERGGEKKNQVTHLHAQLRKRKGRRAGLIPSCTPLRRGAKAPSSWEPRAALLLTQVQGLPLGGASPQPGVCCIPVLRILRRNRKLGSTRRCLPVAALKLRHGRLCGMEHH